METWIQEPWLSVIVEKQDVRYVVDLRLRHFRKLASPYDVIEFDSDQGQELCGAVGIATCDGCRSSVMVGCRREAIRCVRCGQRLGVEVEQLIQMNALTETVAV
jgi:hypothetical protein